MSYGFSPTCVFPGWITGTEGLPRLCAGGQRSSQSKDHDQANCEDEGQREEVYKEERRFEIYSRDPVNLLYYGDNLEVLRRHVKGESVDLIYLDPPFKSNQAYNVLFAERNGSAIKGPVLKHVCRLFRCR